MRNVLARCSIALLILPQLLNITVFSQTRERRTQPSDDARTSAGSWKPAAATPITAATTTASSTAEPSIRVALATDVRSATISTTARLMNATDLANTFVALDVARVRVEPRLLSPIAPDPDSNYTLQIAGLRSRVEAEQKAKEIREATGETSQVTQDAQTRTWGLRIGERRSQDDVEVARAKLEDAGFAVSISTPEGASTTAVNNERLTATTLPSVRPVARYSLPSREVVAFAAAGRLFSSSAPVVFASDDQSSPVRFNDRPYRGRIEVFANTRGNLTVVNVLGLEDYVKGVVPNELSAGGFPLIEAHKAQAIAARTYALKNRGQFISQGYDLLPTTRSQVYRGLTSENSLSSRAVDETRGVVATFDGEPINALYTSTCGGRTEDSQNVFNDAVGYLKARECAAEGRAALAPFIIKTSREPAELKEEQNLPLARDIALLSVLNFSALRAKVNDSWLADDSEVDEVMPWLSAVARLAKQTAPAVTEHVIQPGPFATALNTAAFGESRGSTLLNEADVEYYLAVKDSAEVPAANRSDVAYLIREGYMSALPDATLRPRETMSRARTLHAITRLLEARNLLQLQKATARPTVEGTLVLRNTRGKDQPVRLNPEVFLFRQIGERIYPVKSLALVGGEPVVFHVNTAGEVDYLEVRPAPNGAAADRFSPYSNWTTELTSGQVQARLGRYASGIGSLTDLRVTMRGKSGRATDLEVIGTNSTAHVRGGRIRSALGLREQLFVIEKKYDDDGRLNGFAFIGRGWGHGVGMCQVGAYGLARQGFTYDQILKTYYAGIELTKLY